MRSPGSVPGVLTRLLDDGIHAGLHLGRWYPHLEDCVSIAVTEKRTREEIDRLAAGFATVTKAPGRDSQPTAERRVRVDR